MNTALQWYWVSGATGAWGKELLRQLLLDPSAGVVAYCRGEHRAASLLHHWPTSAREGRLRVYLGDIRDHRRVWQSLPPHCTVIHAAALKCIETALYSPTEMMETNIEGTRTVIEACIQKDVKQAFYLSSDKATNPSTFYGGTKFIAEQLWISAGDLHVTRFLTTRFGNALWSTGSVLTRWEREHQEGRPLSIVGGGLQTRFLLTLQEGVGVILQALQGGESGLLDSPRMGTATVLGMARALFPGVPIQHVPSTVQGERDAECIPYQGGLLWSDEPTLRLSHTALQHLLQEGKESIW